MDLLLTVGLIWLSLGCVKGVMFAQQVPAIVGWYVFHKTQDTDLSTGGWTKHPRYLVTAGVLVLLSFIVFTLFGAIEILAERMRFFTPYGDPYLASIAARASGNVEMPPKPLLPTAFESWEEYQRRMGDDPHEVMNGLTKIPYDKLPESVKKVVETARELGDLNNRDVPEVDEEDEFRKDDDK